MMKKRNIFYFTFLVCFLIILSSCEAEREFINNAEDGKNLKRQITFGQFKNEIGQPRFSKRFSLATNANARSIADFEVDTTLVKSLESNYIVYSMNLEPKFEFTDDKFYNLVVYKDYSNEVVKQIVEYSPQNAIFPSNDFEAFSFLQSTATEVIYSSRSTVEPICTEVVTVDRCNCANHTVAECGGCSSGFRPVSELVIVPCSTGGSEPDPLPDPYYPDETGDTGGGNDGAVAVDPVFPNFKKTPCQKVKELLDSQPVFKQKLKALAPQAATATFEKAVVLYADNTTAEFDGSNGKIEINPNPAEKYIAMAHIHDVVGDGNGTYSVFSFGDTNWLGVTDVVHSKVNLDKFVSFLATADGTFYAITVTDKVKFRAAFNYLKYADPNITPEQRMQFLDIAKKKQVIYDKYYLQNVPHPSYPLIKENGADFEKDLENLINFLAEGNFGISVLETDVNFETFSEVNKKTDASQTTLPRIPCTN